MNKGITNYHDYQIVLLKYCLILKIICACEKIVVKNIFKRYEVYMSLTNKCVSLIWGERTATQQSLLKSWQKKGEMVPKTQIKIISEIGYNTSFYNSCGDNRRDRLTPHILLL